MSEHSPTAGRFAQEGGAEMKDRFETVVAEKVYLYTKQYFSRRTFNTIVSSMKLHSFCTDGGERLCLLLDAYILGMPKERLQRRWPADWWQALRERWFPKWWLRRYPVRYEEIDVQLFERVCPHVNVPDHGSHFLFLAGKDAH